MIHLVLMFLCFAVASAQVHKKGMTMKLTIDGHVFNVNTNEDPLVAQIAANNGVSYTLNGMRSNVQRGIQIRNGNKYMNVSIKP